MFDDFLKILFWSTLFAVVFLGLMMPEKTVTKSYFDDTVMVTVTHSGLFKSDQVSLAIAEEGDYKVSFFPLNEGDKVPTSVSFHLKTDEAPTLKIVKKFSINDMHVSIVKNGVTETQDFEYPR